MRVLKWEIPVDDGAHEIGGGKVALVACQDPDDPGTVTVWTVEDGRESTRMVRVFGTGHDVPGLASHIGTAVTASGNLVWHVFAVSKP